MKGILGQKAGMTQIFSANGERIPVTVVEVSPNVVLQVKTVEQDGYNSLQLGYKDKRENLVNKPLKGHFKKANSKPKYFIREIKNMDGFKSGEEVKLSIFGPGQYVDVTGISKGKGFQGSIKRHNYKKGPASHGSQYHRGVGSMGDITSQVKKSKLLPGHMGAEQKTMQNLLIVSIDLKNNALLIKGSIPGPNLSYVIVKEAFKRKKIDEPLKLVDLKEIEIKNHILEEGKKFGASISTELSISEMELALKQAEINFNENTKKRLELEKEAAKLGIVDFKHLDNEELEEAITKNKQIQFEKEQSDDNQEVES